MNKISNEALVKLLESCDALQRRTIHEEGCMHSSVRCFDACMRAFECKLPAESVTFKVFFGTPVAKPGFAKIHRDGSMQMWTTKIMREAIA